MWRFHLQATDRKNPDKRLLLPLREIQTTYNRHGQNDNNEIGENVDSRICEPHHELIDASCRLLGPECADGVAGKDTAEDGPDGVEDDDGHDGVAGQVEFGGGEDAAVLDKD